MPSWRKLLLLLALYVAQGLPNGFFTQALPVLLRERGLSLEGIGLASALNVPWTLKAIWAPLVERTGTPRAWILILQALTAVALLTIAGLEPAGTLVPLLALVLVVNTLSATQDVATDGLAVAMLDEHERGPGNSVQVAGFRIGMIFGGGALLVAYARLGWPTTFVSMALVLLATTAPLLLETGVGAARPVAAARTGNPWSWFGLPGAFSWSIVLVTWKIGDYLATGMLRPWMVDSGVDIERIGWIMGIGGFGSGLLGAGLAGALLPRLERQRAVVALGLVQATGVVGYAWVVGASATGWGLNAAILYEHFVGGLGTVALFTAMMDASRAHNGATDYTVQASLVVVSSGLGSVLSGFIAKYLGYPPLFWIAAVVSLTGPALAALPGALAVRDAARDQPG